MRPATPKRLPALAAASLALVSLALCALPAAPAGAAEPPPSSWWQVLSGSRPTNLQTAPDQTEVQEVSAAKTNPGGLGEILVARVQVGGEAVGCLGAGEFFGLSANTLCVLKTGFPATETAAGLEVMLEGPYGSGEVEVTGPAKVGEGPLLITTPGHWGVPVEVTPATFSIGPTAFLLGSASAAVKSKGSGLLVATLTNLGNAPLDATSTPLEIADRLPAGVSAYGVEASAGGQGKAGPVVCAVKSASEVKCSFEDVLAPYEAIEVEVRVALAPGAGSGETGEVSVSGGDGPAASKVQTVNASDAPVPFGLEYFSVEAEEEGGGETTRAGVHPFQLTTTIVANTGPQSGPNRRESTVAQPALPRNLRFTLPAGLVGDATAVPTCDLATFLHQTSQLINECPAESSIGVSSVTVVESLFFGLVRLAVPVFNLPPQRGEPARFGLMVAGVPVLIDTSVDPADSYRISAEVHNISQVAQFLSSTTTIWGDPGSPAHDASRGWNCAYIGAEEECKAPETRDESPFLRMPDSCTARLDYGAAFEPWNVPLGSVVERASYQSQEPLKGCNGIPFAPSIASTLTSRLAASASGQDFELAQPGADFGKSPQGTPEAQAKRVEVALPEGVTINPSAAEGLAVCTPDEYARERADSAPGEGCPEASKVGTLEAETPLIEEKLKGDLYVAEPYNNPTGSLLALYLIVRSPERGVLVKQPLKLEPDKRTGQLVAIAENAPPLPYTNLSLHLREGGRAPLITPPGCGTFQTTARFVPWSAQNPDSPGPEEVFTATAPFEITRGTDGGACPQGPAPFHPGFSAGTLNNQAGSYSPFVMRLTRRDGEQDMGKFSFVLPPGVVPKLAGIPYCSDAAIAQAKSRTGPHGGQEERDNPSCPAASQIGRTVAGAGVGNQLTYVSGKLYLAGPYHGDPISAVSITPAVAGPFDAGTVVVREALRLNPATHVGEVDGSASDPIPHILKGIPLNLRDLRVFADRPEFTLNATSCEPFQASSTIWGDGTALAPLGETPVELSSRYQAAGCASLGFKPKLAIKLQGGTKRGAHPALKAVVTPRAGDANFAGAVVTLPHSAFLDQAHIRTICTRVQFAAGTGNGAECPAGSVYGRAKAWTPLLSEPLEGPVFLRSSSHNLPDLVLALHGLVDIDLAARIDSVHGGIRSTFEDVPDAPVSRFVLEMQGGKKGLIVNSTNLCVGKHRANAKLTGQNGRLDRTRPVVRASGCAKKGKAHRRHHRRGRGGRAESRSGR